MPLASASQAKRQYGLKNCQGPVAWQRGIRGATITVPCGDSNWVGGSMNYEQPGSLSWRQVASAVCRAWRPLLVYELLASLAATLVLGPLLAACSYQLIGISDEVVLGNWELAWLAVSPRGASALVAIASVSLGLLFLEYSGLILLANAALRGITLSLRELATKMVQAAPRLFGLAAGATVVALAIALPFAAMALFTWWLLLSGTDINFYLAERPPRFWIAVVAGLFLAISQTVLTIWLFVRWAFIVPTCILEDGGWRDAMRSSARLVRGRKLRLVLQLAGWQGLKIVAIAVAAVGLERLNVWLLFDGDQRLPMLVWSAAALLLIEMVSLELLSSAFAIGVAALVAREYEVARATDTGHFASFPRHFDIIGPSIPAWQVRVVVLLLAILVPLASASYALALSHVFIEHRAARVTSHRAGPKPAPENSLAALRLTLASRADFVELDVQQTSDGHVVLLHDRDLRRVTGDARELQTVTLAELRQLRLRSAAGATDEQIPTLGEFLAACDDTIRLNIELKETSRHPRLANAVVRLLQEHDFVRRAAISCFDMPPLVEARSVEPQLRVGMILTAAKGDVTGLGVDFLSLNQRLVRSDVVRRAHQRGIEVHAWTVNDRATALRMLDLGCDNLITSDPQLMREVVDWHNNLGDAQRIVMRLRRWMRE